MKQDTMKMKELGTLALTAQDRMATGEEVRRATSSSEDRVVNLFSVQGNYCETNSDNGGIVRYPAEEFEFFAYLSDPDETLVN
jgi:phage pi2 protein 07